MSTYPARIYRPRGFTLLEMMVVMGLMALIFFIALPAFQNMLQGPLQREVNRLSGVLRLVRTEAVLTRSRFQLVFDLKKRQYRVDEALNDGSYAARQDPPQFSQHVFPPSFRLRDIVLFGEGGRRLSDQEVPILIDGSGFVVPFLLHFDEDSKPYTLKVRGFSGAAELVQGHVDR